MVIVSWLVCCVVRFGEQWLWVALALISSDFVVACWFSLVCLCWWWFGCLRCWCFGSAVL